MLAMLFGAVDRGVVDEHLAQLNALVWFQIYGLWSRILGASPNSFILVQARPALSWQSVLTPRRRTTRTYGSRSTPGNTIESILVFGLGEGAMSTRGDEQERISCNHSRSMFDHVLHSMRMSSFLISAPVSRDHSPHRGCSLHTLRFVASAEHHRDQSHLSSRPALGHLRPTVNPLLL